MWKNKMDSVRLTVEMLYNCDFITIKITLYDLETFKSKEKMI